MLNKNGRKWLGAAAANTNERYKATNGEEMSTSMSAINMSTSIKIVIGTGSTVETAEDYCLEAEVTEGVERTMWDKTYAGDNYVAQYTAAFTNNTEKSVTIKEIGLQVFNGNIEILVFRKTIDPVKIPAGGIKTFTVALL